MFPQLERIESFLDKKRTLAQKYEDGLDPIESIRFQKTLENSASSYWLIAIMAGDDTAALAEYLEENGIDTRPIFYPISQMPIYEKFGLDGFSVSERGPC